MKLPKIAIILWSNWYSPFFVSQMSQIKYKCDCIYSKRNKTQNWYSVCSETGLILQLCSKAATDAFFWNICPEEGTFLGNRYLFGIQNSALGKLQKKLHLKEKNRSFRNSLGGCFFLHLLAGWKDCIPIKTKQTIGIIYGLLNRV